MSFQAVVTAMLKEGCTAEQQAPAVIAVEQAEERAKETRREKEAEKKRLQRARAKGLSDNGCRP
ncbi:hypothetical protein [Beijerinckia mobilis]|uniref:hypothetical protein n=1 Tax=Beijerinckia mobilis TaxID=231434 RepID=UPI0005558C19|nr:hypothetical protein [Beijerinckia mobilis]